MLWQLEFSRWNFQENKIANGNFLLVSEQAWDWTSGGISALPDIHSLPCDTHLKSSEILKQ